MSAGRLPPRQSAASGEKDGLRVISRTRDTVFAALAQSWFAKAVSVSGGVHGYDEMKANIVRNPISNPKGELRDRALLYPSSPYENFLLNKSMIPNKPPSLPPEDPWTIVARLGLGCA